MTGAPAPLLARAVLAILLALGAATTLLIAWIIVGMSVAYGDLSPLVLVIAWTLLAVAAPIVFVVSTHARGTLPTVLIFLACAVTHLPALWIVHVNWSP